VRTDTNRFVVFADDNSGASLLITGAAAPLTADGVERYRSLLSMVVQVSCIELPHPVEGGVAEMKNEEEEPSCRGHEK